MLELARPQEPEPRRRGAIVLVDPEILPEAARLIADHGLSIECTLDGRNAGFGPKCVLVITGEALPEECAHAAPARVVNFIATTEAYGAQRLTKISEIRVDQRATEDFERRRRQEAA